MRSPLRLLIAPTCALLCACSGLPPGPEVEVMPSPDKTFDEFANDDLSCRDFASSRSGSSQQQPGEAAASSAVAGAAVGAVAGAMLGHGDGEAIGTGAGAGLILGGAHGMEREHESRDALQYRYDTAYMQCMYAKGHQVPGYPRLQPPRR